MLTWGSIFGIVVTAVIYANFEWLTNKFLDWTTSIIVSSSEERKKKISKVHPENIVVTDKDTTILRPIRSIDFNNTELSFSMDLVDLDGKPSNYHITFENDEYYIKPKNLIYTEDLIYWKSSHFPYEISFPKVRIFVKNLTSNSVLISSYEVGAKNTKIDKRPIVSINSLGKLIYLKSINEDQISNLELSIFSDDYYFVVNKTINLNKQNNYENIVEIGDLLLHRNINIDFLDSIISGGNPMLSDEDKKKLYGSFYPNIPFVNVVGKISGKEIINTQLNIESVSTDGMSVPMPSYNFDFEIFEKGNTRSQTISLKIPSGDIEYIEQVIFSKKSCVSKLSFEFYYDGKTFISPYINLHYLISKPHKALMSEM